MSSVYPLFRARREVCRETRQNARRVSCSPNRDFASMLRAMSAESLKTVLSKSRAPCSRRLQSGRRPRSEERMRLCRQLNTMSFVKYDGRKFEYSNPTYERSPDDGSWLELPFRFRASSVASTPMLLGWVVGLLRSISSPLSDEAGRAMVG